MGFVPYIGQAVSVIGFIDTVISLNNNKIVYFKTKSYYANKVYETSYQEKNRSRKNVLKNPLY